MSGVCKRNDNPIIVHDVTYFNNSIIIKINYVIEDNYYYLWWDTFKRHSVSEASLKHLVYNSLCFFFWYVSNTQYTFHGSLLNTRLRGTEDDV